MSVSLLITSKKIVMRFSNSQKIVLGIFVKNIKIYVMKNKDTFTVSEKNIFHLELKRIREIKKIATFEQIKKSYENLFFSIIELNENKLGY